VATWRTISAFFNGKRQLKRQLTTRDSETTTVGSATVTTTIRRAMRSVECARSFAS